MENGISNLKNIQVPNYSGVNIQIFNPTVTADGSALPNATVSNNYNTNPINTYPANYYTQNFAQTGKTVQEAKNTKKKEITELTNEYIKTVEYYLNSNDIELRTMAAKEVLARMKEDKTRKNDPALIALNNKMLKDPKQPIRFLAMGAIEAQYISGDEETIEILKKLQTKRNSTNQMEATDAIKATKALVQFTKTTKEVEG